jgi:hypothetical protein
MRDCPPIPELQSGVPNVALDWLRDVSVAHQICLDRYFRLREAVRLRQED